MNRINKLLFALASIVLASCETNVVEESGGVVTGNIRPVTETTDEYSVTYQYKDGVIVLDDKAQTYLVRVEADTILYFSSSTPSSILPDIGDVLSARVTKKTPYGLGNIVLEKSESGGLIKCVTTTAGLNDIFEELTWEYNGSLTDSILSGYVDENGDYIKPSYVWYDATDDSIIQEETQEMHDSPYKSGYLPNDMTRATIGRQKLVTWPLKVKNNTVSLTGNISVGAFVHCSGDLKEETFDFYVQPVIDISAGSKVGIIYDPNLYKLIDEYPLLKLKDIVKGIIQLGPVTLRPYVDIATYVDFGASGTIDMEFGKTFSAKIGYSQKEGGYIKKSTSDGPENKFVKSLALDGNISIGFRSLFDVGCGLYTKNIALALEPYFEYSIGADCRFTGNETVWRFNPKIDFDIKAGANGRLVINWFGDLKLTPELKFFDTNLFHKEWFVLPTVDESTFSVKRDKMSSALVFDAKYDISGGLQSLFDDVYPGIAVYKGSELVYKKTYSSKTQYNKKQGVSFQLDGLKEDVAYTAKPIITVRGIEQELDGIPFSSTSPTATITDIVQTGAKYGTFYHQGKDYAYEFKVYINAYLVGSENCKEWGLYVPGSSNIYNPYELRDGRRTLYWTVWSNTPTATWTITPYVVLLDGNMKMFETYSHTCAYGGATRTGVPIRSADKMVLRLDSVVYHR